MDYIVNKIPGSIRIDPDAGREERQRKREKPQQKSGSGDCVSISDEAKRRSSLNGEMEPGETPGH